VQIGLPPAKPGEIQFSSVEELVPFLGLPQDGVAVELSQEREGDAGGDEKCLSAVSKANMVTTDISETGEASDKSFSTSA
jgi:hypothetical protein